MHRGIRGFLVLFVGWLTTTTGVSGQTARWEADIAAFEAQDRQSPPQPGAVVFYGSSSFRLWTNLAEAFPGVKVVNRGFGGSQLSDLNQYFDRVVPPHAPRLLLIYGGDNDIASGKDAARVLADFQELVKRVRDISPTTRVAFVAVKPSPSREKLLEIQKDANARIRQYARQARGVDFIDAASPLLDAEGRPDPRFFAPDRLHLNAEGYEQWRQTLLPYFERWLR